MCCCIASRMASCICAADGSGLPLGVTAARAVVGHATGRLYVLPLLLDQIPGTYTLLACKGVMVTPQVEASTPMLKLLRHRASSVESHDPPLVDSRSNVRLPAGTGCTVGRGSKRARVSRPVTHRVQGWKADARGVRCQEA